MVNGARSKPHSNAGRTGCCAGKRVIVAINLLRRERLLRHFPGPFLYSVSRFNWHKKARSGQHDLPADLLPPPGDWKTPFQALAEECGLSPDVAAVFAGVQEFLEEVLGRRTER